MRSYSQSQVPGNDAQTDHVNRGLRRGDELNFYNTGTVKFTQTTRGVRAKVRIRPQTIQQATAPGEYRGVWVANPTSPYMTYDVVLFGTGTSAGEYRSFMDNNTNLPDSGIGWVQTCSYATWL